MICFGLKLLMLIFGHLGFHLLALFFYFALGSASFSNVNIPVASSENPTCSLLSYCLTSPQVLPFFMATLISINVPPSDLALRHIKT